MANKKLTFSFMSTPMKVFTLWPDAVMRVGLVLITLAIYSNVFGHKFLLNWDDRRYVVENESIRGLSWQHICTIFTQPYFTNYAPLHILSYAVDHAIWGLSPAGFLGTNVLLHSLNGILIYALLVRLSVLRSAAALGAALFLIHPVQVESVAWISERKNILCMTFFLLAVNAFVYYRTPNCHRRWLAYILALTGGTAALLTKAAAVVIVPVLALFDICYVEQNARRRWLLDKVPFILATVGIIAATMVSQEEAIEEGRTVFSMDLATTLYTMVPIVLQYIRMVLWPAGLSPMYYPRIHEGPDLWFAVAAGLLFGLVVLGIVLFRLQPRRQLFFWYATFYVALIPVLHIVPLPTLMNDRYLYFPMLGASGVIALVAEPLLASNTASVRRTTATACVLVLLTLSIASYARTDVWRDDISLWRDATSKAPKAALAWVWLGMSYLNAGRVDDALNAYMEAFAVEPHNPRVLNSIGSLYNQRGEPKKGRPYLLRAVFAQPDDFNAQMNLGISYRMTGELHAAEQAFKVAVMLQPQRPDAVAALREVQSQAATGR